MKHTIHFSFIVMMLLGLVSPAQAEDIDPMGNMEEWTQKVSQATDGRLNLSGYVNAHYMIHDGTPNQLNPGKSLDKPLWQIREASLFADAILSDNLLFSTELETSYDFSSQDASGRDDRFEALFNYFYFDYDIASAADWDTDNYGNLSVRAGRILVPFLSYNENKPNFKQNLMSQPFTAWQLAPVNNVAAGFKQFGWTDVGATVGWNYAIKDAGLLDVKLTAMNGLKSDDPGVLDANHLTLDPPIGMDPNVRPRDGLFDNKSDWDEFNDNNDNIATALKVSFAPEGHPMDVGVSWYRGAWDNAGDHDLNMYGVHLNYIEDDWSLKGEYVKARVEQTAGVNNVPAPGPAAINTSTGDYNMYAWYVEGAYIPLRYGDNRHVKLIARYDDVDTNDKAAFTPFDRSRVTLGTEWEFLSNVRLRYEYQHHMIDSFSAAPAPYTNAGGERTVDMNMVSIIAYF